MSFDSPRSFADSFSAAPPSSHPLSLDAAPPDFQGSSAYLLPPRDAPSRHRPFPPNPDPPEQSRHALASPPITIQDIPDILVSSPLPKLGHEPPTHACSCPMSDWEIELANNYHEYLMSSIARRENATATAVARLAEVEREIAWKETCVASIEEQYKQQCNYSNQQRVATSPSDPENKENTWTVDNVKIRTSLPPELRGHTGAKNSYQLFLQEVSSHGVVIEPRCIHTLPVPFATVHHLQLYLREMSGGENKHGHVFANDWLIPLKHHALLVSTDDRAKTLHDRIQSDTSNDRALEVIVKYWGEQRFAYLGSFKPKSWWLPFTRTITGELPELFQGWSKSKDDSWRVQFQHLRVNWHNPGNNLVFCVLEFAGFNHGYYDKLEQLATDPFGMDHDLKL